GTALRERYDMPGLRLIILAPLGLPEQDIPAETFDLIVHKPLKLSQLGEALRRPMERLYVAEVGGAAPRRLDLWQHGARAPRTLLVEDDRANQQLGIRILQQLGCPHTAVRSGAEALDAIERDRYDLVLLDVQLPDI